MPRLGGPDLAEYAAARRPDLVRLGVLMGTPPEHAAVLADRALVRAAREWRDLREDADPNGRLLDLLLEERLRDRTPWWATVPPAAVLPEEVSSVLDQLPVGLRARAVWAALGHQAVPAWPDPDPDLEAGPLAPQLLRLVTETAPRIVVPPPTGAAPARRAGRGLLLVTVVVLVGLGLGLTMALRPGDGPVREALGQVPVSERSNPAPVAWYADGRLQLARVVVPLEGLRDVVEVREGAVYLDDQGRVVRLRETGVRTLLGQAEVEAGLVGSALFGRVAWVTADGEGLEVADVDRGEVVARRDFEARPAGTEPVPARLLRMAGSVLLYTESGREIEWDTAGQTFRVAVPDPSLGVLVDEVGTTQVRQVDAGTISLVQRFGRQLSTPGVGAQISPRQQFVLTRTGEGGAGALVLSVATGEEVASGITEDDIVLDARFSDADRITYLLADRAAVPEASGAGRVSATGALEVRTCQVRTGICVVHTSGAGAGDSSALLAR